MITTLSIVNAVATTSSLNVALPAALPSIVKNVVSAPPSVPLNIISELSSRASIVILPEVVARLIELSPTIKSSAATVEPALI